MPVTLDTVSLMSSLVIFTGDVQGLAEFYESVIGLRATAGTSGDAKLEGGQGEIYIHAVHEESADDLRVDSPPVPRDDVAIKPAFTVDSMRRALENVTRNGGVVTDRSFEFDGLTHHDVLDPDGNVLQLRARTDQG